MIGCVSVRYSKTNTHIRDLTYSLRMYILCQLSYVRVYLEYSFSNLEYGRERNPYPFVDEMEAYREIDGEE